MTTKTRAKTADSANSHRPQGRPRTVETQQRATPPTAAEITSAVRRVLESVPASVRTEFVEAVAGQTADALDESLWGAGPSAAELRSVAQQGLKDDFVARPRFRVALVRPRTEIVVLDLRSEGAAMRIGALPSLATGAYPRAPKRGRVPSMWIIPRAERCAG